MANNHFTLGLGRVRRIKKMQRSRTASSLSISHVVRVVHVSNKWTGNHLLLMQGSSGKIRKALVAKTASAFSLKQKVRVQRHGANEREHPRQS